ncbi:DUF6445 family protein [Streptomyces sp. NBC_01262]|uniref:DUF6445 family protein n=1 Tax=Streptomyces sp. NBC_01262 TaxID=2903803 RepID=UPI002E32226E|nr:DUF6445 family protein [Streptomyces sp. NBC_01262]
MTLKISGIDAKILVLDGFYEDPDRVRHLALSADYSDSGGLANFPGLESKSEYSSQPLINRIQMLTGGPIEYHPRQWAFGKFRISRAEDQALTDVHVDNTDWAAIIYLTPDEQSTGGLAVYANRETGLSCLPEDPAELRSFGCDTLADFDRKYVAPVSKVADAWDRLTVVEARYNRLVLFEGNRVFHGISHLYGVTPRSGRLSHNFFMNKADEATAASTKAGLA